MIMNFDTVFTIKKEHSKEDFLRKVLISLAGSTDSAIDVVHASFGEVKESYKEVLACTANVEVDYTASIGYDRIEEYYVKEQKRDSATGRTYYEDVKKTRKVTDWHPHSGHQSGTPTKAVFNYSESSYNLLNIAIDSIRTAKKDSIIEDGEATVNLSSLETAKTNCRQDVIYSIKFPGDHHKDERYSSTEEVTDLVCYIVPFYEVSFTYKGKKYSARGFACGSSIKLLLEIPKSNVNVVALATNDTKKSRDIMKASWITFAGLFVLSCILVATKVYWFWIFPLIGLITSTILHVKSNNAYLNRLRELTENNIVLKKKELEKVLSSKGYKPLKPSEFDVTKKSAKFVNGHARKGPKVPTILCSIALVILIIVSFTISKKTKYNELHSAEQFDFKITQKTVNYDPYADYYINGCYYIKLTCEISAEDIGAKYASFKIYVYEYGQQIGYINSTLDDMKLEKGETGKYVITISDNQPKKGEFFDKLYNSNLSDLVFEFEIQGLQFDDGDYLTKY